MAEWDVLEERPVSVTGAFAPPMAPAVASPAAPPVDPWAPVEERPFTVAGAMSVAPPAGASGAPATEPPAGAMPPADPGLWERVSLNAADAFRNTLAGETINRFRSGQVAQTTTNEANRALSEAMAAGSPVALDRFADGRPSPYGQMPLDLLRAEAARGQQMADDRRPGWEAERAAQQARLDALPPWTEAPGIISKAVSGGASLVGQLAGGLPSPENLVGGAGPRVVRGVGEAILPHIVRHVAPGAVEAAVANAVTNPLVQSGQVERGEKDAFSAGELGESVLLGAGAGGTLRLAGMGWRALRNAIGRARGVDPNTITPDQVSPDDARTAAAVDPEFKAFAEANGIDLTSPTPDPRAPVLQERLTARRAAEAGRPVPDSQPGAEGIGAIFRENARRADEVQGVNDGTIDPAATNLKPRDQIQAPIRVDERGGAFVADEGALAGQTRAGEIQTTERSAVADTFRLADRQRERAGSDVRDTQTAGRPAGLDDSPTVRVDGEQPVRVVEVQGKKIIVEPYDPRTGDVTGDRYDTSTGKLRDVRYSPEPRMAQDFVERARGPKPPELPREPGPGRPVRDPGQTYRANAPERISEPDTPSRIIPGNDAPKQIASDLPASQVRDSSGPAPERSVSAPVETRPAGESYAARLGRLRKEEADATGGRQRYATTRQRADETATIRAYREDGGANEVESFAREHGGVDVDHNEIAPYYRRADGETPRAAAERAVNDWVDAVEREAVARYEGAGSDRIEEIPDTHSRTDPRARDDATFDETFAERPNGQEEGGAPAAAREDGGRRGGEGEGPQGRSEAPADGTGDAVRREPGDAAGRDEPAAGGKRDDAEVGSGAGRRQDGPEQGFIPGTERTDRGPADQAAKVKPEQPPPPKGGLFDEDARNQIDLEDAIRAQSATLSANPFGNPAAWAHLFKSPGGFSKTWMAGVAELFDAIRDRKEQGSAKKTNAAADVARGYFRSIDGEWRALVGKYKSDTMEEIRRLFHARPDVGRDGPVSQTYHEAVLEHGQGNINRAADILKPFLGTTGKVFNMTLAKDRAKFDQIVKLVENPRNIRPGTPIHDAAAALKKLIDGQPPYLTGAGVDMGKVEGYFPHMIKEAAVRRAPDEFVNMAAREYLAHRLAPNMKEARARAEAWKDHILLQDAGVKDGGTDFVTLGGAPNADFVKERTLIKKSPAFFERFYHTDPVDSLTTYFQRTARRAEWSRRMGDDLAQWKDYKQRMIDEGNAAAIPQMVDLIAASAGVAPSRLSDSTKTALASVRLWGMLATLPRAYLSSLSEIAMVGVRSGDATRFLPDIARLVHGMVGGLKKEQALAEDVGLIASGYGDTLLGQRYFGLDPTSKTHQWVANSFFKATLLEGLTANQTKVAVNGAQTFIRRMALDVADANSRGTLSTKLLNELGISDVQGFSQWALRQSKGRPTVDDVKDGSPHAASYRTAVMRFVNQTIMRPNAQTFTRFASHPVGSLLMQLQSFNFAFTNNVLARMKNLAVESARPGSGLSAVERAKLWGPATAMIPLVAIAAAVSEGRDEVFGSPNAKPKADWEKSLRVASRSGLTGTLDPWVNLMTSARYRTEAASMLAGPVAGKIAHDAIDVGRGMIPDKIGDEKVGPNSGNTNAAERKLAQSFYELVLAPAVTVASLPMPAAVRTPAIQALGLGGVKEDAVTGMAGPKQAPGRGPARPARPRGPERPTR